MRTAEKSSAVHGRRRRPLARESLALSWFSTPTHTTRLVVCGVDLTHEAVGAVFVSRQVTRSTRTQYVGEQFQKRHFNGRLGWHETTVPRRTVRDELITQLTRSPPTSAERAGEGAASEPDTFVVKPVRELRTP